MYLEGGSDSSSPWIPKPITDNLDGSALIEVPSVSESISNLDNSSGCQDIAKTLSLFSHLNKGSLGSF